MVPPLRDLMDSGVFSEAETRAIVTRRRESEYLLRRRVARKADFLRYIESELALERLRALHTKKIMFETNDETTKMKTTMIRRSVLR
eukprot:scaffold6222_cov50-Attheya_sp.AAC.3